MEVSVIFRAATFAADKHRDQRRKGEGAFPYIIHPLEVASVLAIQGEVRDEMLLAAALLHDVVEDTETMFDELERHFGQVVCQLVAEVTDDKLLPKHERKALQIQHAPHLSEAAKQLKIADKICNVRDIAHSPPIKWNHSRKIEYLEWTQEVVAGCRGVNQALDNAYDQALEEAYTKLGKGP